MTQRLSLKSSVVCIATIFAAGCASTGEPVEAEDIDPQWAANGWLTPGLSSEPEIIGLYIERAVCEEAVADWMSRQVVGNPVFGECLPIDRR